MDMTRRDLVVMAAATATAPLAGSARAAKSNSTPHPRIWDVIVLGAGVSGLNAAWLMEQQGASVMVLEGRMRVGGRVYTLMDQPGFPEMGFNSMGAGYGRGIDAAKRAGVELYDVAPRYRTFKRELAVGGRILTREQWAASSANPFPVDRKTLMPWEITDRLVKENNPLEDPTQWASPENAALDISLHDFLKARGLSDAAIHFAVDTSPFYGSNAYDISALTYERANRPQPAQPGASSATLVVKGGNMELPIGMAKLLNGDIVLGKEVVGISSDESSATVVCRDGSSYRAKAVICSLPFSTLRRVSIDPGLTGAQAQAVQTLAHQRISNIFLTAKSPFWEVDNLSPSLWTDGVAGTVMAQYFGKTDDQVTGLLAQARGGLADYWDRLGKDEAIGRVIAAIEAIRPAAKGQLVGRTYFSWAMEPFNAGDWLYYGPGQITAFAPTLSAPAGRIHFCGEHTAVASGGLEGALESSERVAIELITA